MLFLILSTVQTLWVCSSTKRDCKKDYIQVGRQLESKMYISKNISMQLFPFRADTDCMTASFNNLSFCTYPCLKCLFHSVHGAAQVCCKLIIFRSVILRGFLVSNVNLRDRSAYKWGDLERALYYANSNIRALNTFKADRKWLRQWELRQLQIY